MAFFEGNISANKIHIWECCIWLQYKNWQAGRAYLRPFRQGSQGKPEELRTYQIITTEPKVQIFKNKGKIDFYSLEFSDTSFFHAFQNSFAFAKN